MFSVPMAHVLVLGSSPVRNNPHETSLSLSRPMLNPFCSTVTPVPPAASPLATRRYWTTVLCPPFSPLLDGSLVQTRVGMEILMVRSLGDLLETVSQFLCLTALFLGLVGPLQLLTYMLGTVPHCHIQRTMRGPPL